MRINSLIRFLIVLKNKNTEIPMLFISSRSQQVLSYLVFLTKPQQGQRIDYSLLLLVADNTFSTISSLPSLSDSICSSANLLWG